MDVTTDQYFPNVQLSITNAQGDPAPVDGVPVWGSSDDTVIRVTPAADGMSAQVDTVAPGTARVSVQADADMGAGVAQITGVSEDIVVTAGQATTLTLDLGTPAPVATP